MIPMHLNLVSIPQTEIDYCPYLNYLYDADIEEFKLELSKKVPGIEKNSKIIRINTQCHFMVIFWLRQKKNA